MIDKNISLSELEKQIGKENIERLFLEYYLSLIGKDYQDFKINDKLNLNDIME